MENFGTLQTIAGHIELVTGVAPKYIEMVEVDGLSVDKAINILGSAYCSLCFQRNMEPKMIIGIESLISDRINDRILAAKYGAL